MGAIRAPQKAPGSKDASGSKDNGGSKDVGGTKGEGKHPGAIPDSGISQSILIVDDNQDILYFMQSALESAGFRVALASDGNEARDLQARLKVDLLITDIFMPGQDGIETLRDCKSRSPDTRIIVMSAGGGSGLRLDYLPAAVLMGAHATLRKPFSLEQLLDVVRKVIQA